MGSTELLPYATSLGLAFVLIGFVLLIWREGASHRFSTIAFMCFVVGIAMTGWSLYALKNEPPAPVHEIQATIDARTATDIRDCLRALKNAFIGEVQRLDLSCKVDSLGWPDRKCVEAAVGGKALYAKLQSESEFCTRSRTK